MIIKRVSLGLALVASGLGGLAGIHVLSGDAKVPATKLASIQCAAAWDIPDPARAARDKTKVYLQVQPSRNKGSNAAAADALHATIQAPYAVLPAKKTCTGGDPLNLTWETWVGGKHIDDLWFLNSSTDEAPFASTDPLGLRTWAGRADPPDANIVFTAPQPVDARLSTDLYRESATWGVPWTFGMKVVKYGVAEDKMVPHGNVGVTLQYRCHPSQTWLYYGRANSDANGLFSFAINETTQCPTAGVQLEVQGVIRDTADAWGFTQSIQP